MIDSCHFDYVCRLVRSVLSWKNWSLVARQRRRIAFLVLRSLLGAAFFCRHPQLVVVACLLMNLAAQTMAVMVLSWTAFVQRWRRRFVVLETMEEVLLY